MYPYRRKEDKEANEDEVIPLYQDVKDRSTGRISVMHIFLSVILIGFILIYTVLVKKEQRTTASQNLDPVFVGNDTICAFMTTKQSDGMQLYLAASTLLTSQYPNVAIVMINTDRSDDESSRQWLSNVASSLNEMYEHDYVTIADISPSYVDKLYPNFHEDSKGELDYRYLMVDLTLQKLNKNWGCEYFMTTSARNIYNTELIPTLTDMIRENGYDMIGWEYVAQKYVSNKNDPEKLHRPGYGQQIYAQFKPGYIEHGGAIVNQSSFFKHNMSFILDLIDHKGNWESDAFDSGTIDAETFMRFASKENVTSHMIQRTFQMYNEDL